MNKTYNNNGDPKLAEMLEVIFKFASGDLTARGTLSEDDSALDGVMAGINILGEELEARIAENKQALEYANTLIRSSPDGVLAVDLNLRITEWNLLMEQMCGKGKEQVIGQALGEIPFMQETGEAARVRQGLDGESIGPREVAYRIPGTDKESYFESVMAPLRSTAGQIIGAVLRVRDITERKRVQEALSESENWLRTILESVQAGIVIIDPEIHRIVDLNHFAARMIGAPKESIIGAGCHKFICPAERNQCPITDLDQTIDHSERVLLTATGERREIIKTVTKIQLGGRPHLLENFIDSTERKQSEGKIQNLNQALEEKVRQLTQTQDELVQHRAHLEQEVARQTASLTDAQRIAHLGNWEWDLVNNTLSWSDEMYRIFGLVPQQFGANYEAFLNQVYPEDRQLVDDTVREALARQHTYSIEHRILQSDGTLRYVHGQAEVMQRDDGQPISMVGTLQDITERKQAEEQLRKQHAITTLIIETIPMRVFWKDRALHYLGCNTAFARDAGKSSPDELLGKDDFQMGWKDQAELYRADDKRVMDTDTPKLSYDEPQTTPTGERIWLRTSKVPLHNEANEVMGMLGVYEDITEYKQMELKFLESEKRFRNLAELTTDWVWQVDEHGTYVYSGAKIQDLLGYDPEEVVGKTPFDFMPPEEAARVAEIFQDIISKQNPFSYMENINLHKDGHKVILETSAVPLVADDGTFNGYFGTERDITERKQMEIELRESELAYRTLAQNLPGLVYRVFVREGERMQFYNAMPVLITGYAVDELTTGTVCSIEPLILDEDRPGVMAEVKRAIAGKRAFAVEYRLKHKDGGIRWMAEHGMPVYGTDGAPVYIDGVILDITEHKQAEIELQLFRTLIDNSSDAIEVLDPATLRFLDVNETECRELGYSREELLSMKITDIDSSLNADLLKVIEEQIRKTGTARFEGVHRRKDGSTFPVEVSSKLVELDKPYALNISRDNTERNLAEAEVQKLQEQLRDQALHDPLTGLYNRRYLDESMGREMIRAERYGRPIGIVMCDIDHFKIVNDTYGHLVGDEILRMFAELLKKNSRGSDIVCRFGGEEFLLLLPDMPPDIAYQRAEQLRTSLAALQIGKEVIRVTASFGVAAFPENGKTMDSLIGAADVAMYQAKEAGRNRVVVSSVRAVEGPEHT